MTQPGTLLTQALLFAVCSTSVGLVVSNGSASVLIGAALLSLLLYGSLAIFVRRLPRVVAVAVTILSTLGVAANMISPNADQLLVALLSVVSVSLAVAALRGLSKRK